MHIFFIYKYIPILKEVKPLGLTELQQEAQNNKSNNTNHKEPLFLVVDQVTPKTTQIVDVVFYCFSGFKSLLLKTLHTQDTGLGLLCLALSCVLSFRVSESIKQSAKGQGMNNKLTYPGIKPMNYGNYQYGKIAIRV